MTEFNLNGINSEEFEFKKTVEVNGREAYVIQRKLRIEDIFSLDKRIGNEYVDGRELHEVLGIGTKYTDWMNKLIEKYGFEEELDYISIDKKVQSQNRERTYSETNHKLSLDTAKEIAMIQRSKIGKQVRKYFLAIEKDYIEYITGRKEFTEENRQESLKQVTVIQEGIVGTFAVGTATWQKDIHRVMQRLGGMEKNTLVKDRWKKAYNRAYDRLEEETGVNLYDRVMELKNEKLENGFTEAQADNTRKIDVIAKDIELIKVFNIIVQEQATKKKVEVNFK